jgi:hypothetical protein
MESRGAMQALEQRAHVRSPDGAWVTPMAMVGFVGRAGGEGTRLENERKREDGVTSWAMLRGP